ncbi:sigma-70 family RNA polymerase sigma factor [Sorangium sp. So ce1036]|uniref:RNA polymerase sigma factor n=1 Tax=Sorangium sp. So ce1036 TaxID=3133328 RepID=UPI003F09B8B5
MAAGSDPERAIRLHHELGDFKEAVGVAILAFGREMFAFFHGILGEQDAADASSELWEAVLAGVARFRWSSSFRTWIYAIARRTCNRFFEARRRQRRQQPLSQSPELQALEARVRTETLPYLRSKVRDEVARIRDGLDPEARMLLALRVDRGLPWHEVASIMLDSPRPDRQAAARLRQRYRRIKEEILQQARQAGLLGAD